MSLVYDKAWLEITDPNERFWTFYRKNEKEFGRIIWQAAWKYKNTVDPEDMHSELLLRMHRSDFLESFNPQKSILGTFVTGRVMGYAAHIAGRYSRNCHPFDRLTSEERDIYKDSCFGLSVGNKQISPKKVFHCSQVLFDGINTVQEGEDCKEISEDMAFDYEPYDEDNTILQKINKSLRPSEALLLRLYMAGNSHQAMADKLKTPINKVRSDLVKIKKIINYVLEKNKPLAVVLETSNKNHHSVAKRRPLSDDEKELIRNKFIAFNGMISNNLCTEMMKSLGEDISVFQVTGYIVTLHKKVMEGQIDLRDLKSYKNYLNAHRAKWATYKSAKYQTKKLYSRQIMAMKD